MDPSSEPDFADLTGERDDEPGDEAVVVTVPRRRADAFEVALGAGREGAAGVGVVLDLADRKSVV